jgi:hypothetical protein
MKNTALPIDIPFIDITKLEEKKEKMECVWDMGCDHAGTVTIEALFTGLLEVSICEHHLSDHRALVALILKTEIDMEKLFDWSCSKWAQEIALRGIIPIQQ